MKKGAKKQPRLQERFFPAPAIITALRLYLDTQAAYAEMQFAYGHLQLAFLETQAAFPEHHVPEREIPDSERFISGSSEDLFRGRLDKLPHPHYRNTSL